MKRALEVVAVGLVDLLLWVGIVKLVKVAW